MRRGYTLIELIVTMVIIGILSATAYVSLNAYDDLKVEAAAKKIAADLDYARNLAISTAKWYRVDFAADPANNYQVYDASWDGNTAIDDPSKPGTDFIVNLNDSFNGVKITLLNLGFDADTTDVYFHPLGTPYQDYGLDEFCVDGQIFLRFGDDGPARQVRITRNTGRVEIIRP